MIYYNYLFLLFSFIYLFIYLLLLLFLLLLVLFVSFLGLCASRNMNGKEKGMKNYHNGCEVVYFDDLV